MKVNFKASYVLVGKDKSRNQKFECFGWRGSWFQNSALKEQTANPCIPSDKYSKYDILTNIDENNVPPLMVDGKSH